MRGTGIDFYERYQPNYVHQDHHTFATIKVADGKYVVPHKRVWEQAKNVPILIAYLYLKSGVPAKEQVDALLRATADSGRQPDGYMVDFERTGNTPSMQFGATFKETIDRLEQTQKFVQRYSNPYLIQDWLLRYGQTWVIDDDHSKWVIAQYPFNRWAWRTAAALTFLVEVKQDTKWNPRLPAGFNGWGWWQYSADGNNQGPPNGIGVYRLGIGPAVDLQVYNGTREHMLALFGKGDKIDPPTDCAQEIAALSARVIDLANGYGEVVADIDDLVLRVSDVETEIDTHEHTKPQPGHDVWHANVKCVLRIGSVKNAKEFPMFAENIYEPRIKVLDGGEVWTTGPSLRGNGGVNAKRVVGPMELPNDTPLFALDRQLRSA